MSYPYDNTFVTQGTYIGYGISIGNNTIGYYCQSCGQVHALNHICSGLQQGQWESHRVYTPYIQEPIMTGTKHLVVCNGHTSEHDTLAEAQSAAEACAHKHSADAYILKPIKRVSPKRDVVTTDL